MYSFQVIGKAHQLHVAQLQPNTRQMIWRTWLNKTRTSGHWFRVQLINFESINTSTDDSISLINYSSHDPQLTYNLLSVEYNWSFIEYCESPLSLSSAWTTVTICECPEMNMVFSNIDCRSGAVSLFIWKFNILRCLAPSDWLFPLVDSSRISRSLGPTSSQHCYW